MEQFAFRQYLALLGTEQSLIRLKVRRYTSSLIPGVLVNTTWLSLLSLPDNNDKFRRIGINIIASLVSIYALYHFETRTISKPVLIGTSMIALILGVRNFGIRSMSVSLASIGVACLYQAHTKHVYYRSPDPNKIGESDKLSLIMPSVSPVATIDQSDHTLSEDERSQISSFIRNVAVTPWPFEPTSWIFARVWRRVLAMSGSIRGKSIEDLAHQYDMTTNIQPNHQVYRMILPWMPAIMRKYFDYECGHTDRDSNIRILPFPVDIGQIIWIYSRDRISYCRNLSRS